MDRFIDALMNKMTLEEKIGQLNLPVTGEITTGQAKSSDIAAKIKKGEVGGLFNLKGVEKIREVQKQAVEDSRLGIPLLFGMDVIHGYETMFPIPLGLSCTWDMTAIEESARIAAVEASADGISWTFSPMVDISRDPRWGRGQETYGEDPYLTGQMGMAVVRGLQGPEDARYDKLHACAKHFAVHSGPEWNRHSFDAENIAPRDLWETYLPAFKDLVQKAHVKEVMCAYNRFEGEPCCGSNRLLMQILRDEWGYKGIVVSDCGAISDFYRPGTHGTHPDKEHASADAVRAGTDLECGSEYASLADAVKAGLIDEKEIDISLKRLLTARFELGEMDEQPAWSEIPTSVLNSKEHQALALRMARESLVLLQNKN
ncbi:hypothetical protein GAS36_23195, partial [Phocaeicola vulgatus]